MIVLEDLFRENNGEAIIYKGKEIIGIDRISVPKKFKVAIRLISTNSEWKQAVDVKVNGKIYLKDGGEAKHFALWESLFRDEPEDNGCVICSGTSKDGIFLVWNAWENKGTRTRHDAWTGNGGMIKEEIREGVYRYYCNDGHLDKYRPIDFDDIIFEVEVINQEKE